MELILFSAIKFYTDKEKSGFVLFTGKRHSDIYEMVFNSYKSIYYLPHEEGFVTSKDRFVDRYEAIEIAKANGQFEGSDVSTNQLYSEDLW